MGLEALEALRFDNRSQMKEPLDHLPDANAWHYFLQLNIYRRILQEDYGVPVSAMYLGVFHPSRSQSLCVRVPLMDDEMELLFSVSFVQYVSCANVCVAIAPQASSKMANFIACVAEQAKCSEKETKNILESVRKVLQEQLETGQKVKVSGLFTAVAVYKDGRAARTKKCFGKTLELPPKAPHTVVKLTPSRKLCVTRAGSE